MFWVILIGILAIIYFNSLNKDNNDLQGQSLSQKFEVIVNFLNKEAFNGFGAITVIDKREFNLYRDGDNQLIKFHYSSGHLTITWRYKYLQKETIHEKQFNDVRNLSTLEQYKIANEMISEMLVVKNKHVNGVKGIDNQINVDRRLDDTHEKDKNDSLIRLARNYNCPPSEVKQKFIEEFTSIRGSVDLQEATLNVFRKEKLNEANLFNIDSNDTASAIMESWLIEFFASNKKMELDSDFLSRGGIILMRNAKESIAKDLKGEKYLYGNFPPDTPLDLNGSDIENLHAWAKYKRRNADFIDAINIVDRGLNIFNKGTDYNPNYIHFFYSIRSKANLSLKNAEESLSDIKNAYSSLKINDPKNLELIDIFYSRILVLQEMGSSKIIE